LYKANRQHVAYISNVQITAYGYLIIQTDDQGGRATCPSKQ